MVNLKSLIPTFLVLGCLALPGVSAAAPGDLTYAGCFGDEPAQSCVDLPGSPLTNVQDVAVSPDGRSVYAVSRERDAVLHFFRGAGGELGYDGCVNSDGRQSCTAIQGDAMDAPSSVAVSPDGLSVYVTGRGNNSITEFKRLQPDGQLVFSACAAQRNAYDLCADLPEGAMLSPRAATVSPDGNSVYVAGRASDSVTHFFRAPTGGLGYGGCVSDDFPQDDCGNSPVPLGEPVDLAVSPDGRSLYVAAYGRSGTPGLAAIVHFDRQPQGQLVVKSCLSSNPLLGCTDAPGDPFREVNGVVVSPDNGTVHTLSGAGIVSELTRDRVSGQISWSRCVAAGAAECPVVYGTQFGLPGGLAIAPDGRSLYVGGSGAIAHLTRGPLAFGSCLANVAEQGCGGLLDAPLAYDLAIAASPDGRSVYVASPGGNTLARFDREQPPVQPTPTSTPTPTATPGPEPARPTCSGQATTIVGTAGADRLRGTRGPDVIAALGGSDRITGLRGNDVVCGGPGRDRISGGAGRDRLDGGRGRDRCLGGKGRDRATSCETKRSL